MTAGMMKTLSSQNKYLDTEKNYWLNKLSGELVKTYFPYDSTTSSTLTNQSDYYQFEISGDLFSQLNQLTRDSENNLFVVLLVCFVILLNKYTGNKDIIIAAPIYKQEFDGEFLNTALAIRLQLTGEESIKNLLLQCKNTIFEANEYLNYPLERLVDELDIPFSKDLFSLLEIGILLENIHHKKYIKHLRLNVLLSFVKTAKSLKGVIEYDSQLYKKDTIDRIAGYFIFLLEKILNTLDSRISDIEILSREEKRRLLIRFNETGKEFPKEKTIHELFEVQVEKRGNSIAAVGDGDPGALTYTELNEKSNQLGRYLGEKGVNAGTIVGIIAMPSIQTLIGILAILKTGGAYLPIDATFPVERINFMLQDSRTHWILNAPHSMYHPNVEGEFIDIYDNSIYKGVGENPEGVSVPGDIIYMIYTSGTSGKPKGVLIKNENLVNYVHWFTQKSELTESDKTILTTSFAFDLGYTSLYTSILNGGQLHILPREMYLQAEWLLSYIKQEKITYMKATPSFFSMVVNHPDFPGENCKSLRLVVLGGEVINVKDIEKAHSLCSQLRIMNHYGPTESTIGCIATLIDFDKFEEYRVRPVIGKPINNTVIYILGRELNLLPVGVPGELCIAGAGVGMGYLNRPQLTAEKFDQDLWDYHDYRDFKKGKKQKANKKFLRGGPGGAVFSKSAPPGRRRQKLYKSGDLARWLPDGNIEFMGRFDQQVKIRGYRIELGEIVNRLLNHEKVIDAEVMARENPQGDKYLCVYFVPGFPDGSGGQEVSPEELKRFLAQGLPDYMIPAHFVQVEKMPLTKNGKIDRNALPEPGFSPGENYAAPRDSVEEILVETWADVLKINKETLGIDDNFFELGGHSLNATILISRIHKLFNVQVPLAEIFRFPHIRGLASYIKESGAKHFTEIPAVEKKEYYPLTSQMKRLYFEIQIDPESVIYINLLPVVLEGNTNRQKWEDTFRKLIRRHEGLRTSFVMVNDRMAMKIHDEVDFEIEEINICGDNGEEVIHDFNRRFDLFKAPLLRVGLAKTGETEYILVLCISHTVEDGTSLGLIVRDLMALYEGKELAQFRIQYKDFSEWQTRSEIVESMKRQEEYWMSQFSGDIHLLELPRDYPRPPVKNFEGSIIFDALGEEETRRLKEIVYLEKDATLYMVLLTVFYITLFKLSDNEDIIVGTPMAGRKNVDLELILGMFVNTVALRNYPSGDKTFKEFFNEVRNNTFKALENQDFRFEKLVDYVNSSKKTEHGRFVDVFFGLHNWDMPIIDIPGLRLKPYEFKNRVSRFDIEFHVAADESQIYLHVGYCTRLFKESTIEKFINYFKRTVSEVIEKPGKKITDIDILSEKEKIRLLYEFNDTEAAYPKNKTIHRLFEEQAEKTPDNIALVGMINPKLETAQSSNSKQIQMVKMQNSKQEGTGGLAFLNITYRELNKKSHCLAHILIEKGVEPDAIVAIKIERSIEMIIGILGILKSGCAYLPIDPQYPEERIQYMLADSGASVLVTSPGLFEEDGKNFEIVLLDFSTLVPLYPSTLASSHLHLSSRYVPVISLAYIIYTSGTTGRPKGVMIEHGNVVRLMFNEKFQFDFSSSDTWTMFHSYCFDFSVWEMYGALLYGGKLAIIPKALAMDSQRYLEALKKEKVTILNQTPSAFYYLMNLELTDPQKELYIRYVIFGGEALTPALLKGWKAKYPGTKLINMYGITETTVHVTFKEIGDSEFETGVSNIGKPIPTTAVFTLDQHMQLLPVGVPGELYVGGKGVGRGYLNQPELTAEKFKRAVIIHSSLVINSSKKFSKSTNDQCPMTIARLYRTGDLARWMPDGDIEYLGRIDHQVKIRGYRIELGEIQNQLANHPHITDAAVLVREREDGEKYIYAYIVGVDTETFENTPNISQLRDYLSESLPNYMIPSHYVKVEKIPITVNGKIDRKALEKIGEVLDTGGVYSPPTTELEKIITEAWKETLRFDKISIHDNFFDLGGNSLHLGTLNTKLRKILNRDIPIVKMFTYTTVHSLAIYLSQEEANDTIADEEIKESVSIMEEAMQMLMGDENDNE